MKKTIPERNLEKFIEYRRMLLEREKTGGINEETRDWATKQYIKIYGQVEEIGKDLSNYPKPEALWRLQ